jgi:hypothetical protein
MGQFSSSDTRASGTVGAALSADLASAFAGYINSLGLKSDGKALTLETSSTGVYQAGTYYDYLMSVAETSLNNFLADTTFPYTPTQTAEFPGGSTGTTGGGMGGVRPSGALPSGALPTGGALPSASATSTTSTTYDTVQDYIDSLNTDTQWISYDAASNTAAITSLQAFVEHCKTATKGVGAFDELDRGQGENNLLGNGQSQSKHFDAVLAKLLKDNADKYSACSDWNASYVTDYETDLAWTDSLGTSMQTRLDMYNPMYFLSPYYDGYQTSTAAKYWRIRTGIDQSDTALTVETNLALALQADENVKDVDFATVWGMKHVEAERTGDSTTNFISWVNTCMGK